ncbi:winged helix-turn-helix domain-containing protein [Pseudoalteromonas obscura]|uniref:Winged helix-turn-helix domain-containing protein n=1 Tax=Pseudoalteromonas obscura TaxID=3048491 RepID=A0ABT7EF99_9GAMM|nr:winged helix-turn-helix domain-containing protein [Pseudoalteromonas sp. P94(2023)]MDK2593954.1 winged helix-turn-helix domain-containing protein [Pseudoalteromonas sp. P94(2023)]
MPSPQRFFIEDHLIDLSRSEIISADQSVKVEPKVLQVLLLLAQNAQQVVSHQDIMEQVWQGTEVVPNALQRCIARLRKVLGDDAKSPRIIATHPKIGYRLMTEVRWDKDNPSPNTVNKQFLVLHNKQLVWGILGGMVLLTGLLILINSAPQALNIKALKQLTFTDAFESEATYSPDGQYIVFNRHVQSCQSHIWAKNIQSGVETRLSADAGFYRDTRFTPDGRSVIYTKQRDCTQQHTQSPEPHQANCWQINMLDFAESLVAPQVSSVRYQCQERPIERPIALANHNYTFLSTLQNRPALVNYNAIDQKIRAVFTSSTDSIYTYDYAPQHNYFAVLYYTQQREHVLAILDSKGKVTQQNPVELDDTDTGEGPLFIRFSSTGESLLAIKQGKLYQLSLEGKLTPYNTTVQGVVSAQYHPKSSHILTIAGNKDTDISHIPLYEPPSAPTQNGINQHVQPYPSFARSKSREKFAKYQPQGELIAFVSARSGRDQIWLWDGKQATQLSQFVGHIEIEQLSWSPSGKKIAVVNDGKLNIIDLKGKILEVDTKIPLTQVLSWHHASRLLVTSTQPSRDTLWELDIDTSDLTQYPISDVKAAWVYEQNLYISNFEGRVLKQALNSEPQKPTPIPTLNGNSLVLHQDQFYSYDSRSDYLSMYDLNGELLNRLKPLKPFAWKISDVKGQQMLLEQLIELNQDIFELSL